VATVAGLGISLPEILESSLCVARVPGRRLLVAAGRCRLGWRSRYRGRRLRPRLPRSLYDPGRVAVEATLRAFAVRLVREDGRGRENHPAPEDVRVSYFRSPVRLTLVLVLDNSFSMHAASVLDAAASAVAGMITGACRARDKVAVVAFTGVRRPRGVLYYGPGRNWRAAFRAIRQLPVTGRTPLGSAVGVALRVLRQERYRDQGSVPYLVVISDFQPNAGAHGDSDPAAELVAGAQVARRTGVGVVAVYTGVTPPGVARRFAGESGGLLLGLGQLLSPTGARGVGEGGRARG